MIETGYPYTHITDYLRSMVERDIGIELSRAEATHIRYIISKAIGAIDEAIAAELADAHILDVPRHVCGGKPDDNNT